MDALSVLCAQLTRDVLAIARAVFKGVGRLRDQPPEMLKKTFFNKYCICLYSKVVVYEDAHKQAPRGEIAASRYVSEPQKCPKMRLRQP